MFTEDLSTFFDTDAFGQSATLAGVAVVGIFDAPGVQGSVGGIGMASTQPVFTLASASVPAAPVGAALVIGSATYAVVNHDPDGTGISRLILERAA